MARQSATLEPTNGRVTPPASPTEPAPPRRRLRALRTLTWRLLVSVLIVLVIAEIGLRLVGLGHLYQSEAEAYVAVADPEVMFRPRPGYSGFSDGAEVRISSQSLRDREYELLPPTNTTRLLVLGDSVTFGPGALGEETYVKQLEQLLNVAGGGSRFEVVNAGVIGYNTIQERRRLQDVGLQLRPNVVILTFLVNDLLDTFSVLDNQYEPRDGLAPVKKWLRRHSHLYRFYQNISWRVMDASRRGTIVPEPQRDRQRILDRQAEIGRIAQLSRDGGARFFLVLYPDNLSQLVTPPDAAGRQETVRENFLDFARRHGYPVLDLTDALGDVRDPRARVMRLREDPHPSPAGHRAIAEVLLSALRETGLVGR